MTDAKMFNRLFDNIRVAEKNTDRHTVTQKHMYKHVHEHMYTHTRTHTHISLAT